MTLLSKTLPPAQEAKIAARLATASRLDFPTFCKLALKHPHFVPWFERRFATMLTKPEQISPEMREAFMVDWERDLRNIAAREIEQQEQAELDALDDAPEPFGALPMTRAEGVHHARENEDSARDDGDGEESEDDDPADAPSIVYDPPARPEKPYPGEDDPGVILLAEWCGKFRALSYEDQEAWQRTHVERIEYAGPFLQSVYLEPLADATIPDTLADFEAYSETVRRIVTRKENRLKAHGLSDAEGDATLYLVPFMIPAEGPTMFHGHRKSGKSSLAHKLVIAMTCDLDFDGVPVPHGRVLYVSADAGARIKDVALRVRRICNRLGIPMPDPDRLMVLDAPVNLTDPAEVEKFLSDNPGPWALVVIDPFYRCVGDGDLAQMAVASAAENGYTRIAEETGAPVLLIHHDTKDGRTSYGSAFIEAGGVSAVHFERHVKDNTFRDGDRVTVKTEWLKNDSAPAEPFEYWIEGAYLATKAERGKGPSESAGKRSASPATAERADMLARLPTEWRPIKGSQKLVDDIMPARLGKAGRDTLWVRLRRAWEAAGLIEQKDGRIRRV
jgi:hypothetical protein